MGSVMRPTPHRRRGLTAAIAALATVVATVVVSFTGTSVAGAADGSIVFVAAGSTSGNRTAHTVRVPDAVRAGDLLLLALTINTDSSITAPTGWTQLEAGDTKGMDSRLWSRQATPSDAGSVITAISATISKGTLSLSAYRSSVGQATVAAHGLTVAPSATSTLTTPTMAVSATGSWLADFIAFKSSAESVATLPAGLTTRSTSANTGGGLVGMAVADSGGAVATGNRGGATISMSPSVSRGTVYSVIVKPGTDGGATNHAPSASFTSSCTGLACTFDASASSDPDGDNLTYSWDFGDGSTGDGDIAARTYGSAGTRTVTLTVDDGTTTSRAARTVVASASANRPPVASFTSSCSALTCSFDASASSDPDGDPLAYAWDFGDGASGSGVTASRSYATSGTRSVTLKVSDGAATSTATHTVSAAPVVVGGPGHTRLVSDTPLTNQPKIMTGEITDLAYIGDRVFVVGGFTSISNNTPTNKTAYSQRYLASWNRVTGLVDPNFRPAFDDIVTDVQPSPDGSKLFVAGRFNTVNGVTKRKFASINPVTGATIANWTANADAAGTELEATNTRVFLGGQFTKINGVAKRGLAAVDATTGALVGRTGADPAGTWTDDISGGIGVNGALTVQELLLTPDQSRLIVVHTGRQINGQDRYGVGVINAASGALLPWRTRLWEDNLGFVGGVQRAYGGAMSPDGASFYVSSGSGGDRPPINDTVVKFPVAGDDFVEPLWVSRAFDSVYSVAASERAVYIGGHFSWSESQTSRDPWPGLDNVGYGTGQGLSGYGLGDEVLRRDHLGALDPQQGKGVDWNPGSNSFEGNEAMLVTPWGVVTGGDATTQGGYNVGRIAVFNLLPPPSTTNETTISAPVEGRVEVAGEPFTATGTAHAASGVKRVQVQIRNRSTKRYLQGDLTTWGTTATNLPATLSAPNAADSGWSLALTLSGNLSLEISARTVAVNGSKDTTKDVNKFETFSTTDKTPTATITGPTGVVPSTTFTITGTATDDYGIRSIGYVLKDSQNRFVQDDGSVSATYNAFTIAPDVPDARSTTWSTEVTVPFEGEWMLAVTPRDTAGQSSLDTFNRRWIVSSTSVAPSVTILTPVIMNPPATATPVTVAPGSRLTFTGTATDDEDLAVVEIQLRNTSTGEAVASDGTWRVQNPGWYRVTPLNLTAKTTTWSYSTPFNLTPGAYTFTVRASDDVGLTTASANQGRLSVNAQIPGDSPPDTTLDVTGTVSGLQSLALALTGTANDDLGVASVKLALRDNNTNRYLQEDGTLGASFATLPTTLASPGATNTTWTFARTLPTEGDWRVTAYAYDTAGQQDPSTTGATAAYPIYPGDQAPVVVDDLHSPTTGTIFTDGRIIVSGRVEDDRQIAGAQVAIVNDLGQYLGSSGTFAGTAESWRAAFLNSPGSPGSNYSYTTPVLPAGTYTVRVRGVDNHAFMTTPTVDATVTVQVPASQPPVAAFSVTCGVPPNRSNTCSFDARGTTDENPSALTYAWDLGNGVGTGAVLNRTYTAAGTYTVILTARDEWGNIGTVTHPVTITEPSDNAAPSGLAIDQPACSALSCSVVARFRDNVGDSATRVWSWGDGTADTASTGTVTSAGDQLVVTSHTFAGPGTYNVAITVADGWGRTNTVTRSITVGAG